jgi:hypothetical protein
VHSTRILSADARAAGRRKIMVMFMVTVMFMVGIYVARRR